MPSSTWWGGGEKCHMCSRHVQWGVLVVFVCKMKLGGVRGRVGNQSSRMEVAQG